MSALLFFVIMGEALNQTGGGYSPSRVLYLCIGLFIFWKDPLKKIFKGESFDPRALFLAVGVFTFLAFLHPGTRAEVPGFAQALLGALRGAAFVLVGVAGVLFLRGQEKHSRLAICVAVMIEVLMRAAQISASPAPHIDVFTIGTQGADFILKGINPYAQTYPSIYDVPYPYPMAYVYWPGLVYCFGLARGLFGDIRFALLFADLLSFFLIYKIAIHQKCCELSALMWGLLWLAFPASGLIIENAWNEPLMVCAVFAGVLAALNRKMGALAACLAGVVSIKQHAVVWVALVLLSVAKTEGVKSALRLSAKMSALLALLFLPFLVWDFWAFWQHTVLSHFIPYTSEDALSIPAILLKGFDYEMSGMVRAVVYLSLGIWGVRSGKSIFFRASVVYFGIFLFGNKAFCNYYYFTACFVFLAALIKPNRQAFGAGSQRSVRLDRVF